MSNSISSERTTVARRLRALPSDVYAAINEWESDGLFIEANRSDEADYSQIHNALLGCFPPDAMHPCDYEELHNRLADLIDPVCHIVCIDDTYNTPETGRVDEWYYECSRCGGELDDSDMDAMDEGVKPFDYCPNCGARVLGINS